MPDLILKRTGAPQFVAPELLADAISSGLYEAPAADQAVPVQVRPGLVGETTVGQLASAQARGSAVEGEASFRGRERTARIDREQGGLVGTLKTIGETALDEASLGLTGALGEAIGGDEYTEHRLERQEANPIAHGVTKVGTILGTSLATGGAGIAGKIARATPLGAVTKLGASISKAGEGASTLVKAGRLAAGGAVEGGLTGAGQAVQQLVATEDRLTVERIASTLSSNVLTGVAFGGGANLAAAAAGKALRSAKGALDKAAKGATSEAGAVVDDLAEMDPKQLRTARKVEIERLDAEKVAQKSELGTARKTEIDALETGRVAERAELAGEIGVFRRETAEAKLFLSTKGIKEDGIGKLGRRTLNADREIDRLLDNPKMLAERPQLAKAALQKQEAALEDIIARRDVLVTKYAADESGARMASLDAIPAALERNRALQARLAEIAKPHASPRLAELDTQLDTISSSTSRASQRLDEIDAAKDALAGGGPKGFLQKLGEGAAFSTTFGAVAGLPIPGAALAAPLIASAVSQKLFGALGKGATAAAARTSKAVGAFLDVSSKAAPAAPVLATKVLGGVRYDADGPKPARRGTPISARPTLAEVYKDRAGEIRAQTAFGPDGRAQVRRSAREQIAARFSPIAAINPLLADQLETIEVRKREFLASKLPRRPDIGGIPTGPDRWQPSDMEMRAWARYAAAVEDPGGVEERLADGTVTPEDAEVMRDVYPERMAEITRQILERLPSLRQSLPYERRLALSIFSGVPVDPAMDPTVFAVLQGSFVNEPGTEGGTQAPVASPAFGSVKNQDATPSQQRQGIS